MKKYLAVFISGIIAGSLILFFVNQKWPINNLVHKESKGEVSKDIIKNSGFSSITSKLEPGGDLYAYLNTEKIAETIEKSILTLKDTITSSDSVSKSQKKEADKWFGFLTRLLKESGLLEISGLGISSREFEKGLTRSRFVVQHNPGKGDGLIWNLTGNKPGDLELIDILPEDTVFTSFSDFNYSALWNWIKNQAEKSGDDKIRFGIGSFETDIKDMGIDLPALLKSINGDSGFLITLDHKNKVKFPVGDKNIEFPEPAFAFIFETGDDSIFELLSSRIPDAEIKEEKGRKMIMVKTPPLPFAFSPAIIKSNNLLIIASTPLIAEKLLNSDDSNGLRNSKEFIKLSAGIPDSGNGFTFMSSLFFKEIMRFQMELNQGKSDANRKSMDFMKKLGLDFGNLSMFRVTARTDEGYVITTNSTIKTEILMMLPIAAAGGIVAAIAIPGAIKKMPGKVIPEGQSPNLPSQEL